MTKNVLKERAHLNDSRCGPDFTKAASSQGQAMLLAVLTLGATMLGATTLAGLLMVYQIRQATDFGNSAKAIFAADAGTEWALYNYFQEPGRSELSQLPFVNGASTNVTCYDASSTPTLCTATTSYETISKGLAGNTARAFLAVFGGATTTLP